MDEQSSVTAVRWEVGMLMAKCRALGIAGLALWSAMPAVWAQGGSGRFDGVWRVEFSGNTFCYGPHGAARWTIRNGVIMTGRGRGTVNARGHMEVRYPGSYFGHMNAIVARLAGNQGTGSVEVEGTRCRETITLNRVSG
jgi:hypothetical protein